MVESWLEGGMNDGQDKDGYSADEGFSVGWTEGGRWGGQKRVKFAAPLLERGDAIVFVIPLLNLI